MLLLSMVLLLLLRLFSTIIKLITEEVKPPEGEVTYCYLEMLAALVSYNDRCSAGAKESTPASRCV